MERNPGRKRGKTRGKRRAMLVLAIALAGISCSGQGEDPISPHAPPRPTTQGGAELMHAHFHLPARPVPPSPGMM